MIDILKIRDFKSVGEEEFRLRNFTLLAGTNSSGKSSVIQSLLLAVDNLSESGTGADEAKSLRNTHFQMMSFNDSRNYITNAKRFSVELTCGGRTAALEFKPKDDAFISTVVEQAGALDEESLRDVRSVFHLSAIRSGDLGAPKLNPNPDFNPLGLNGEYLIDYYFNHKKEILSPALISYPEIKTLEGQVNYWLKKLTDYTLTVDLDNSEYRVRYVTPAGKSLHPYNVGTGVNFITQTLIACLASKIGGIVIVENPEIHLHPAAQAAVLDFFVMVANAGIQVIVESHSDHFFNGIRRSLKCSAIGKEQVAVYSFSRAESGLTKVDEVRLSEYGGIEGYIPGMFDQFDNDLDVILS